MSVIERTFCRSRPWGVFTERTVLPWALQGLRPEGDLLELGAGSGGMAAATADAHPDARVTATDVDPVMVEAAQQRLAGHPQVQVRQADVTDLPFEDCSFDVVASHLMLHHVIEWERALAEAYRVLRPGGVLVGYDLTDSMGARVIHLLDRSPHALIDVAAFAPGLRGVGFGRVEVTPSAGGRLVRFRAERPHNGAT
jgi:ubiquinone/menaquinone biosynthesis C-methylase UbiE